MNAIQVLNLSGWGEDILIRGWFLKSKLQVLKKEYYFLVILKFHLYSCDELQLFSLQAGQNSFSQATAEAMCLAKTVVCFESGGPPEILGETGIVIKNFNIDEATTTIRQLLQKDRQDLVKLSCTRALFK